MTTKTFTTPKGAEVKLTAHYLSGFDAEVNGKPHTMTVARFVANDKVAGPHVALAGHVKAQVQPNDVDAVAEFFRTAEVRQAEDRANYKLSDSERSAALTADMDSEYSAN